MSMSSPAGTSDGKSSNSKGKEHTKVADGEMGSSMTMTLDLKGEVEVLKKVQTTIGETNSGTNATDNIASKRRKRKKMKNINPNLGDILSTRESMKEELSTTKILGVKCNEVVSGETTTLDADIVSKEQDHTEVANGKIGESETTDLNMNDKEKRKKKPGSKNKRPTLGEILNSQCLQSLETAEGEMGSGTISPNISASRKQKRQKLNKNSDLGGILSTRECTPEGLSTTKFIEGNSGETVLGKTADADANMASKGDHTEVAIGMTGESEATNLNVSGKEKKKKKMKLKKKRPTLGEILSPRFLQNLEASKVEKGSGTTSTDNPASKKHKRQKSNKNSDLGDILSTCESTQEGLSTTKALEVKGGKTVSTKHAAPDANMVSKGDHIEVADGKTGKSETTNLNVNGKEKKKAKSKNKRPTLSEILNPQYLLNLEDARGETTNLNVNDKEKKKARSKNKRPTLSEILNPQYLQNLEDARGEMRSGTTSAGNRASQQRKREKMMNNNSDLGNILSTRESTQEGLSTKVLEVKSGETVWAITATLDANIVSNGDNTEVSTGKTGECETTTLNMNGEEKKKKKAKSKNKRPTFSEILNAQCLQNLEVARGEMDSGMTSAGNPASQQRKRAKMLNNNSDLGDILSTRERTQEGSSTTKVLEVKSDETALAITATLDANIVSNVDNTEVSNGKTWDCAATNLNMNGEEKKKKKPKSKNKQPTLSEILNPQYLQNLEVARGEMDSGTTSAGNPASQQRKREKMLNNYSDLGDILSTRESTHEGLSKSKVLDANIVTNGDNTEVSNGKSVECETTNLNMNGEEKKKTKLKSKHKRPTLGDILNPQYVQYVVAAETGSGTTSTDNPASKKQKKQRLNRNSDLGDMLNNHENTQKGLSTTNVLEVKSCETVSCKTATSDAKLVSKGDHTEASNGKMQENQTNNLIVNGKEEKKKIKKPKTKNNGPTLAENFNPQYVQNVEAAKHEACSESTVLKSIMCPQVANIELGSTTIVLKSTEPADLDITEAKVNKALGGNGQSIGGKEITQIATVGKKLIILDVNGLLADVVSGRPRGIVADKYVTKRAIFKRPYLDDFLRFCFERFNIGIWSSRTMRNLSPVVDFLLGDLKKKLLFLWDGCKCTDSGIGTLEKRYKQVVVKDLRKIWDEDGPEKAWVKGTFHESNTLLVDDSPYKALVNPKHTGIFPASYSYKNSDDNFLGPKGELQTYLEGLAAADDVKTYVEQHPFGQGAIDEQSPHWAFYSSILEGLNDKNIMECAYEKNKWKRRCNKLRVYNKHT